MTARPASGDVLWQSVFGQVDAGIAHCLLRDRAADRSGAAAPQDAVDEVVTALIRKFTAASTGRVQR
jgi:hypothetical protein